MIELGIFLLLVALGVAFSWACHWVHWIKLKIACRGLKSHQRQLLMELGDAWLHYLYSGPDYRQAQRVGEAFDPFLVESQPRCEGGEDCPCPRHEFQRAARFESAARVELLAATIDCREADIPERAIALFSIFANATAGISPRARQTETPEHGQR